VVLGWSLAGRRDEGSGGQPKLNCRAHAMVGREFTLDAPIVEGSGRVRVDDSSWRVAGPDAPAGAAVRVVGVDGATLMVEAAG
jgi:inner membrane protein